MPKGKHKNKKPIKQTKPQKAPKASKPASEVGTVSCTACHQPKKLRARLASAFKESGLSLAEFKKSYVCAVCKLKASNASKVSATIPAQEIICTQCHQPKKFMGRMKAQFDKTGLSFEAYKDQYVCGLCNAGVTPKIPKDPNATNAIEDEDMAPQPPKEYKPIIFTPKPAQSMDLKGSKVCWHQTIFLKNRTCDECGLYEHCGYHAKALSKEEQKKRGVSQLPPVPPVEAPVEESAEVESEVEIVQASV